MNNNDSFQAIWEALQSGTIPEILKVQARILIGFLGVMWALEILDVFLRGALNYLGIRPRSLGGLRGILFAPILHGNLQHLFANTLPFLFLGWLVMLRGLDTFWTVTIVVWLTSGIGAWLFGAPRSLHLGASGVIFGFLGFLLLRGYFERSLVASAISIVAGFFYGSLLWGVLPVRRGISWQGHLFGFAGGILSARYLLEIQQWFQQNLR